MHDEARLRLFRANTLVDLVKKVSINLKLDPPEKADETKDNKRRRITQVAQSIKQQQLEVFFKENGKKYGPQYFKLLQKMDKVRDSNYHLIFKYSSGSGSKFLFFSQYIESRNEAAHETPTEFAILLHTQYEAESTEYRKWGNLFPYVYGKTVKEIAENEAAKAEDADDDDEDWA